MSFVSDWLSDPQASAAIAIGLVAGTWALAQFRPLARERRRETYDAMTTHYVDLRPTRDAAVPVFPPVIAFAQQRVRAGASRELQSQDASSVGRHHLARVISDIDEWTRYDIAFTSAREVLESEAKFRSLLWAVEVIRAWDPEGNLELEEGTWPGDVLLAAKRLVHDFNAFLFHYENGNYPSRQTLGLLHRSLAVVSKAMEPVVWAQSLDGRYGRRTLRIGLAAQHFNDVTPIHSINDLVWIDAAGRRNVIHPRLKRLVLGSAVLVTDSPVRPRLLPGLRLLLRSWYWYWIGLMSPSPRLWFLAYGGVRLWRHRRAENELGGLLGVALGLRGAGGPYGSLDFSSWDLDSLHEAQRIAVGRERRERGRLAWLWLPKPRGGRSGNE